MTADALSAQAKVMVNKRARGLRIIENWESRFRVLLQDYADSSSQEDDVPEFTEEQFLEKLEALRGGLYEEFSSHLENVDKDLPHVYYERLMYSLVSDRMRRYYGYYTALSRAQSDAQSLNTSVGDIVFEVDTKAVSDLATKIDEVYFAEQMCRGLGLTPNRTDAIVNYIIDREFKPKSK